MEVVEAWIQGKVRRSWKAVSQSYIHRRERLGNSYLLLLVRLLSIGRYGTDTIGAGVRWLCERWACIGRSRCGTIARHSRFAASAAHLPSHLFLMGLKGGGSGLEQGVLNGPYNIRGEDWVGINRSGNRLLPGLQHLLQLVTSPLVH